MKSRGLTCRYTRRAAFAAVVLVSVAGACDLAAEDGKQSQSTWWSLQPMVRPPVPSLSDADRKWARNAIDAFVARRLRDNNLSPSREADRRTLIRRLYFDLIGLPPTIQQIDAFVADARPDAYERLVDQLLASPRYGERWARHWLDVVHYADTHGYDKDKLRANAWPYRDYVIRSLNSDKPYARFVLEQVAGDALFPDTTDGITALGFLAAGPWDFVGHAEVPESKLDGRIARNLDRDDMVRTVFETFNSTTVGCARCHDHPFDPVSMQEYYSLQAVFAAVDRADRPYARDPAVAKTRATLTRRVKQLEADAAEIEKAVAQRGGAALASVNQQIREHEQLHKPRGNSPAYGYHSGIMPTQSHTKWVQVDLGAPVAIERVMYVACSDAFNSIGDGFGFPVRYKIEISNDAAFERDVVLIADHTESDVPNPGVQPQVVGNVGKTGRYIRFTATKLAPRQNDYIFALAELMVFSKAGENVALGKTVTSLDSIEAPVRWTRKNMVDGLYPGRGSDAKAAAALATLQERRQKLMANATTDEMQAQRQLISRRIDDAKRQLQALPREAKVYATTVHHGSGNFRGRGGLGPREIHVLKRGDMQSPGDVALPGTVGFIPDAGGRFRLADKHDERERRAALAKWLVRKDHPMTWRSIVNRVWQYHFGRGIVNSPSDFGEMGQKPTHPRLLDWLAIEFRDGKQSLKQLHKLMVTSATYRQVSDHDDTKAQVDGSNRWLWRMPRRRLEAESIYDAVLAMAGKLDTTMGGPGYRAFVLEKPQHSPHYQYHKHDPDDAKTHRRSIYRFVVRSAPDPLMDTLDCADPSQMVPKRNETITALQALAMLNNKFMTRMAEHLALRAMAESKLPKERVVFVFTSATGRRPTQSELDELSAYAAKHGLANMCRVVLNLNAFVFVD